MEIRTAPQTTLQLMQHARQRLPDANADRRSTIDKNGRFYGRMRRRANRRALTQNGRANRRLRRRVQLGQIFRRALPFA